ncbi:MAG: 1,4-beta-xylanase [Armatimonadetes bacterium]|nr:1,4-beta-xylanase [Armatimonadota bacterium]
MTALLMTALLLAPGDADRWTAEQAWSWYMARPWLVGCNYVPATAVNDVAMWQAATFDAKTIDRELGLAQDLGFNTVRVFLNYVVWEDNPVALKANFGQFLTLADKHGLVTLPILFDDCFKPEPRVGPQEAPEPGVHNSQWVQSPGASRRDNRAAWPKLEQYVKDLVGTFAADPRVLAWELYNEPTASLPLVEAAFGWARAAKPSQPLTTTVYGDEAMQRRIAALSDVLSFHNYGPLPEVTDQAARLLAQGRPVLCTEWLARGVGSQVESHLPYFRENKVACWNWGLVAGRTQTMYPWGSPKGAPEPAVWHHDLLRPDGTPYSKREVQVIKVVTGRLPASAVPVRTVLVATAERTPQPWRFTLAQPAADWFSPTFADTGWQLGAAPFGTEEARYARRPMTIWTTPDIWLRRAFTLPEGGWGEPVVVCHHDEDVEVYLNGVLAARLPGYNATYDRFDIAPAARAALRPGRNLLAVHCRQTRGGQYVDVGIEGEPPSNAPR